MFKYGYYPIIIVSSNHPKGEFLKRGYKPETLWASYSIDFVISNSCWIVLRVVDCSGVPPEQSLLWFLDPIYNIS